MPKFTVTVTRETTESTTIEVEAADASEAEDLALEQASADYGANVEWSHDECSGMQSEPYTTNCDLLDEPCPVNRRPQSTCPDGCTHGA